MPPYFELGGFFLCRRPELGLYLSPSASNAENISIWWRHHVTFDFQG